MTLTTVVIGDIGGHFPVLETILQQLGITDDGTLPDGLQVIQVGDLVRAEPQFREANTQILRRMGGVLTANAPDRWVQLIGNHECAALGGPAKTNWSTKDSFDEDCVARLRNLWDSGRMVLAYAVDDTLITHAGLTRGRWRALGSPATAIEAADLVNRDVGHALSSFSAPGRLVTDQVSLDADTMWAEINDELLMPWLRHADLPFSQIHGHAAPYHWREGAWWPGTPEIVRRATNANPDLRRSVTSLPGTDLTITSVDWTLEDQKPTRLWPLLCLRDSGRLHTMAEVPALWHGPGFLFSVSSGDERYFTEIGGPRARIATWERRWVELGQSFLPSIDRLAAGERDLVNRFRGTVAGDGFSFELDVSWNDETEALVARDVLREFLPDRLHDVVASLPAVDEVSINENRAAHPGRIYQDLEATVLDIPVNTLPSTRQRTRGLVVGTRWVRLVVVKNGLIALWHPAGASWAGSRVPWPHNAIPSRSRTYLDAMRERHVSVADRQQHWLNDAVTHESYFVDTWLSELEFWQDAAFQWLTKELTLADVSSLREDLGLLSGYLNSVRWTQRALARRVNESGLKDHHPECAKQLETASRALDRRLPEMRHRLTESFDVLSTISQRVQEDAASRAKESSERLNWLITLFTAILFVPTVVAGVYGANVDFLADGARGSIWQLLAIMSGLALLSYGLLNIVQRRWGECILGVVCGVATVLAYEVPSRALGTHSGIIWAPLPVVVFLVGMVIFSIKTRRST